MSGLVDSHLLIISFSLDQNDNRRQKAYLPDTFWYEAQSNMIQ